MPDEKWLDSLNKVLDDEDLGKYTLQVAIPALQRDLYYRYHEKAVEFAKVKHEYEAKMYLSFYVIWKYKLWRVEYDSFNEYCLEIDRMPLGVSDDSIKHKIIDIRELFERGMTTENIIKCLGRIPMATRRLLAVPPELLPKKDINQIATDLVELGPAEAGRAILDMLGEPFIRCIEAIFDDTNSRVLFKVKTKPADLKTDTYTRDYVIQGIEEPEASWLIKRLNPVPQVQRRINSLRAQRHIE